MVHFIEKGSGGGGGGGGGGSSVSFNPPGGIYISIQNVTITVAGATKLRWKIDSGAWTIVNATSTIVSVTPTKTGRTLFGDALDSNSNILASRQAVYETGQ